MKGKIKGSGICVVIITGVLIVMAGRLFWGQILKDKKNRPSDEKKITFIAPMNWDLCAKGIQEAARIYGMNVRNIAFAELDIRTQNDIIKNAIYAGVDGIITVARKDSEEFCQVVASAGEHKIPVVLIDTDEEQSERLCYVGTDNRQAGYLAGTDMIEAADGKETYIGVMVSTLQSSNQRERLEGFREAVKGCEYIHIRNITEVGSEEMQIKTLLTEMLKEDRDINALYCTEGHVSTFAGAVIQELGRQEDITVICFGVSEIVREWIGQGLYYSSLVQDYYQMGYQAVEKLDDFFSEKELEDTVFYTDVISVRKENIESMDGYSLGNGDAGIWQIY